MHKFDRVRSDNDEDNDDLYSVNDDISSVEDSNDRRSSIVGKVFHRTNSASSMNPATTTASISSSAATSGSSSVLSSMFSWGSSKESAAPADDYDRHVLKKFDLSVFGDGLGGLVEREERVKDTSASVHSTAAGSSTHGVGNNDLEAILRRNPLSSQTLSPSQAAIDEAVQW